MRQSTFRRICNVMKARASPSTLSEAPNDALGRVAQTETLGSCPVCGCAESTQRFEVSARQAAYHFVVREADPDRFARLESHLRHLWGRETCRVAECKNCKFCYADPFVAGDATFYTLAYDRRGYPKWKWEYEVTLGEIRQISGRSRVEDLTLLEVGAGDGAFIKSVCPSIIKPENVLCTEYSDYGIRSIEKLGVRCLPRDVREIRGEAYRGRFSLVCLFQIVEHMDRLDELFSHLQWLTGHDAAVFISVPNENLIHFYEKNGGLLDMPPNHVGRWNKRVFELMAGRNGWRVQRHEVGPRYFVHLFKRVATYRYLRRRQYSETLSNRIAAIRRPPLRRLFEIGIVGCHAVGALTLIPKIASPELGDSQWVKLVKT